MPIENIVIDQNIIQTNSEGIVVKTYLSSLEEYIKCEIEKLNYEVKNVNILTNIDYTDIIKVEIEMKSLSYDKELIIDIILKEMEIDLEKIIIK